MVPRRIAQLGKRVFPTGLWEGPADRRWVALTFDDGPDPEITPRVLRGLRRAGAPAAFFLIGGRAARHPDLVRRILDEGHAIGNHTWDHRPLAAGACRSPLAQLERTEELLARLAPGSPKIFRPPFGAIGPGGPGALARAGLLPIYWSVVPADWNPLSPESVVQKVMAEAHPGAVIVLHGGRPWHVGTAEAVERLVERLRAAELEPVPLARMIAAAGHAAGSR